MTAKAGDGHSYNRTLAASLGFADEDKRNPMHELACHYLMQPDVAVKLATAILSVRPESRELTRESSCSMSDGRIHLIRCNAEARFVGYSLAASTAELVVSKGEGKYQTTVGFIDVLLRIAEARRGVGDVAVWACDNPDPLAESDAAREYRLKWWPERDVRSNRIHALAPSRLLCSEKCRCCNEATQVTVRLQEDWPKYAEHPVCVEVKAGPASVSDVIRQINLYREYCGRAVWVLATPYALDAREIAALANEKIHHVLLGDAFREYVELIRKAPKQAGNSAVVL